MKNMKNKKSFLIYTDQLDILNELSDEQAGKLFKAIKAYQMHLASEDENEDVGSEFDGLMEDLVTRLAFYQFRMTFDRDVDKYQRIVERNRNNGMKAAEKKKQTRKNPKQPKASQSDPKSTDNDSDNDSDIKKEKLSYESTKKVETDASFSPAPSREPSQYENFMSWMKDKAPAVYRNFGRRMTEHEYERIRTIIDKADLVDYVLTIENRKDLLKKYSSLYLTLRNWIRRDEKKD